MKSSPENLFAKLFYTKQYFTPFNWDIHPVTTKIIQLKGLKNNRPFNTHYHQYKAICDLFPYDRDIDSLIYGLFLTDNPNIYSISSNVVKSYIHSWNGFMRFVRINISKDIKNISNFIKDINMSDPKELFKLYGNVPPFYKMYRDRLIELVTLGALYERNHSELFIIKERSSEQSRSIEFQTFLTDVYKAYKLFQLVKFLKKKTS